MQEGRNSSICTIDVKRQLYKHCKQLIEERIQRARASLRDAQEAAEEETKSSAGDKYETGRAMMLMEMDKHGKYLADSIRLMQVLDQLDVYESTEEIMQGCLVKTNHGLYYLAISLGSVQLEGQNYYTISPASPIGTKLMGLKRSDSFELNGRQFRIEEIC